ncbi:WD40-repeat-containing domain protein [Syncephalis fuscata]|nr:WD40-repeat-containing domain protein [Syncephalis fuscata]
MAPHFQLRNHLWATSKNDVFYSAVNKVCRWNPLGSPRQPPPQPNTHRMGDLYLPMTLHHCAARWSGDYYWEPLDMDSDNMDSQKRYNAIVPAENSITNYVDIIRQRSGTLVASNDKNVRIIDMATRNILSTFTFSWDANCIAQSPDTRLFCVVGDDLDGLIIDAKSGQRVSKLIGHIDYSFACSWSPNGLVIATGNQGKLYDVRKLSDSFAVLSGYMGAIRSLRFSDDGAFLAMAEPADFVHIIETRTWNRSQVIDMFGEIGGISFTPDDATSLFIGNADSGLGAIMEYERNWASYDATEWLP